MKLKIPPAAQAILFGLLMYIIDKYITIGNFTFIGQKVTAIIIFSIGILITIVAIWSFIKAKTTSDPTKPSKATTSGHPRHLQILKKSNVLNNINCTIFVDDSLRKRI